MGCRPCQENRERIERERAEAALKEPKKAYTVIEAAKDVVSGRAQYAPEDEQKRRTALCLACEKYNQTFRACNECKCIVASKVRFSQSSCPLNKWEALPKDK